MTERPSSQVLPGWYGQPDGSIRYWDGARWTRAVTTPRERPRHKHAVWSFIASMAAGAGLFTLVLVGVALLAPDDVSPGPDAAPAPSDRALYRPVTPRELAQIVEDPDAHAGERVIIHARVTQLDAATGPDHLLAEIYAKPLSRWGFPESAFISASRQRMFAAVVEGDRLRLWVEVDGVYTYDTQLGGDTTAPHLVAGDVEITAPVRQVTPA